MLLLVVASYFCVILASEYLREVKKIFLFWFNNCCAVFLCVNSHLNLVQREERKNVGREEKRSTKKREDTNEKKAVRSFVRSVGGFPGYIS